MVVIIDSRVLLAFLFFGLATALPLRAQFSPGKLAQPHAVLEGMDKCTQCHELGSGLSVKKCLACHQELQVRLQAKRGYHFQAVTREKKDCFGCHGEHAGRDFALVHWPNGQENFDHAKTGYELKGKHRSLKCRDCHRPDFIREDPRAHNKAVNLRRTFLGLRRDCLSCHFDEHRRQLGRACSRCHQEQAWKPAPGFDHDRAKFRLTGRHKRVACQKCHPRVRDARSRDPNRRFFAKFVGLEFRNCTACHEDVHRGKFGKNCRQCHQTSGWKNLNRKGFDHSKTRFPLRGLHATVDCSKCHKGGNLRAPLQFSRCDNCHKDVHLGQFKKRQDRGRCESCHSEQGFIPAKFTSREHQTTRFALTGAHLAEPCIACHELITGTNGKRFRQFVFTDLSCTGCHKDVHKGQFAKQIAKGGCETCHGTASWDQTKFDHNTSRFPLRGKHATVACRKCHVVVDKGTAMERILFKPMAMRCKSCHKDPHVAQFSRIKPVRRCEDCHRPLAWSKLLFRHNRDSRFPLKGEHAKVDCSGCHKRARLDDQIFVLYRPINPSCKTCHSGGGMKLR